MIKIFLVLLMLCSCTGCEISDSLSDKAPRVNVIVPIAAFAVIGDEVKLERTLENGLESGLTINEINEVLVQIHAYAGFPRSIAATEIFKGVVEYRKNIGINDLLGKKAKMPTRDSLDRWDAGYNEIIKLTGTTKFNSELFNFSPELESALYENLYGGLFKHGLLSEQERLLIAIAALSAINQDKHLANHIIMALNVGADEKMLEEIIIILNNEVDKSYGDMVKKELEKVLSNDIAIQEK